MTLIQIDEEKKKKSRLVPIESKGSRLRGEESRKIVPEGFAGKEPELITAPLQSGTMEQRKIEAPGKLEPEAPFQTLQKGKSLEDFFINDPANAAPVVREFLSDAIAGPAQSREEILRRAEQTGEVSFGDIASRTISESIPELIPLTPLEIGAVAFAGKAVNEGAALVAKKFPVLTKSFGEIFGAFKEFVTTKKVKVPYSKLTIRDFLIQVRGTSFKGKRLAPDAVSKETFDILKRIPEEDLIAALKKGSGIEAELRIPRFGKDPLFKGLSRQVPEVLKPSQFLPEEIGNRGHAFINENYPVFAQTIQGKKFSMPNGEFKGVLTKSVAKGEEIKLAGGTPEEASRAVITEFNQSAKPLKPTEPLKAPVEPQKIPEVEQPQETVLTQGLPEQPTLQGFKPRPEGEGLSLIAKPTSRSQRIPPSPIINEKPKPLRDIVFDVSKGLKTRVITGKPGGKRSRSSVVGTYYPGSASTVVKYQGDLNTTAHELAHSLDDKFNIVFDIFNQPEQVRAKMDDELSEYWFHGSATETGPRSSIAYKRGEGVAEYVRAFLVNPEEAMLRSPILTEFVGARIPDKTTNQLKIFSDDVRRFAGAQGHEQIMSNVEWKPEKEGLMSWLTGKQTASNFRINWADKANILLVDDLHAFNKAADFAMGEKGISTLLPENDPRLLARLSMGVHAKMDGIFKYGMVNGRDERITPGGIKWMLETLDNSSLDSLNKEMQETASFMIAQRTIEKVEKPLAKSLEKLEKAIEGRKASMETAVDEVLTSLETKTGKRLKNLGKEKVKAIEELKKMTRKKVLDLDKSFKQKVKEMVANRPPPGTRPVGIEQLKQIKRNDELFQNHKDAIKDLSKKFQELKGKVLSSEAKRKGQVEDILERGLASLEEAKLFRQVKLSRAHLARRVSGIGAGIESDFNIAQKRLTEVQKDPVKFKRIQEAAERYRTWADLTLRYMVEKGRLAPSQYKAIKDNNEYFVAMNRLMEIAPNEEIQVFAPKGKGGKIGSVSDPIKRFKGSTRTIENPYASIMDNTYKAIKESDRNEVMKTFRDLLFSASGMSEKEVGKVQRLGDIGRLAKTGEKNTIPIYTRGEKEVWQFDKDVFKALKGMVEGSYQVPWMFTVPAKVLRATIINFPAFAVRNWWRDITHRVIVSDVGSGLGESLKLRGKMEASDLALYGGDQSGHYMKDKVDYVRAMDTAMREISKDKNSVILNPRQLGKTWGEWMGATEQHGRLAEYAAASKNAKAKGMDPYNAGKFAASKARGIMDFAVAGSITRFINQMVPFTSAGVRGVVVTAESAAKNPAGFVGRWAAFAVIPAVGEYAWNYLHGDIEEYRQLPAYQRDMFYNFKYGPNGWIRIPKSFEIGILATGVTRGMDLAMGNKNAFDGYGGSLARGAFPFDEAALGGPFGGLMQAIGNYDSFRRKHIVPTHEEKLDLNLRNAENASRVAKQLQKFMGVDARKIDFMMREFFGYAASTTQALSDIGREEKQGRLTGLTGLISQSPAFASQDVQWVYDLAGRRNLVNRQEYKIMQKLTTRYFNARGNDNKDKAALDLRKHASRTRKIWEKMLPSILAQRKLNRL